VTVYAFRTGHNWTRNWIALPTHYNEANKTLDANISAEPLTEHEWLVVSDNESLHNASVSRGELRDSQLMGFDGPDHRWNTSGDTHFDDGSVDLNGTDRMAQASRTLAINDDSNGTITGRYRTFENATLTVTIANEHRSVTRNYSSPGWQRFEANTTGLNASRATVSLATSGRARIDWLRVTKDSDGDGFDDATERIGSSILAPYCVDGASLTPFQWARLELNASLNDTDGDGLSDGTEVHLKKTVNDERGTLTVRLDGFHYHPNRIATWELRDGEKPYVSCT
jgi:hypothetical protein